MSAEEVLRANEKAAVEGQIISRVSGKRSKNQKKTGLGAGLFITAILVVFLFIFSSGNMIPTAISERLIEETDVQYADAVQSKILVFQQALSSGDIPDNTTRILKEKGVLVGYVENGEFIENNKSGRESALLYKDKVVLAGDFATAVQADAGLYNAFTAATYSRAAYYYDDSAKQVFREIGTNRNNYTADSDFDEVMGRIVGEGSDIDINNVTLVQKTNERGEKYYVYETVGAAAESNDAATMVASVSGKNTAGTSAEATLNAADQLNKADSISKKQRSERLFVGFMENVSKMKAGEGNESKINEAMNYLYRETESEVVDVSTGEVVTVSGSMLESPSLYAILSGEGVDTAKTSNYSSDRVLKTVENQLGAQAGNGLIQGNVVSSQKGVKGSIGRYVGGGMSAESEVLTKVTQTIDKSLVSNSFETMGGVAGGEMLVEGAVSVGAELAKASGASLGDAMAVTEYARLTSSILALDAKADRLNRSPFDITSKNTFLGSIVYNMAISVSSGSALTQFSSIFRAMGSAVSGILPAVSAEDEAERYLANFGDCKTIGAVGAVGSATCAQIVTFDTSTLNDIFNDPGFVAFVEANTTLDSNGTRKIKPDSALADYIKYNNERSTPAGMMDGGILASVKSGSSSYFVSDILSMVQNLLGASEGEKRMASGAAFVNSSTNGDWETYKYAQRYVSLARATESLRAYADDETAYMNLKYFEGTENPVVAFLNEYYYLANQ
ncbi:MAG: hypothetical protein Q4B29_00045 [Candidatus Saccharibacteria bacterium]|nr:hypothetical protein [Candidatus Saccharibacteria bacterium]